MENYKAYIKGRILMAAGLTLEDYEESEPKKNNFGNDPIDIIILKCALKLSDRHFDIFGLLYKCHEVNQTKGRVRIRKDKELDIKTFNRYVSDSRTHIVNLLMKDDFKKIKKAIKS